MAQTGGNFSKKHGDRVAANPDIEKEIVRRARNGELACAVAFTIVEDMQVEPAEVGKNVDLINYRLVKCQLGLFGYQPVKKIVKPAAHVSPPLQAAIETECRENRILCRDIWRIAARLGLRKMQVSSACETLDVKIKHCQLGAF